MERAKHDPEGLDRELAAMQRELHGPSVDGEALTVIRTLNRFLASARWTLRKIVRESRDPKTRREAERGLQRCGAPTKAGVVGRG